MPTHSSGLASGRYAVFVACLLALAGCNPHMYDEVPALHDAKPAEVSGSWLGHDRTHVVLRPDGRADIRLLDGQEWDFDDRWRLSGTGTWKLTDRRTGWNDGQHVRLTLISRTGVAARAPEPGERLGPPADGSQAPDTYTWTFELERDDKETLRLYFIFGDPDSRSTYTLEREVP
ncbi:hypothetical protein F7R91_36240 [Streptomyces luteolifulvus]|uniref:Uncharacterized protein n=1 Tax=Streptomyces luteolifulvus TaxID=2615112 RepID=A0A6H9UQN7_9ACTN|nr:hypothetical protein [Streptomyces luteolifulvus]KAB1140373.1 hypothetical protein F7R91_36240 [Streptomyces luteolifulvus]